MAGIDRRRFLRLSGIAGAGGLAVATGAGCGTAALTDLVADAHPPLCEETWRSGVCGLCTGGCGTRVRIVEGRAVKIEGDPNHPVSRGGLCARGQAAPQALYNPDRVTGPLRREGPRGSGNWRPVTWEEAIASIRPGLERLAAAPHDRQVLFLSGSDRGHRAVAVDLFLESLGAAPAATVDPFQQEAVREASATLTGLREIPSCDLERCAFLLSIGAGFVSDGPSPVRMQRGVAALRDAARSPRGRFVHVEPRHSPTAAAADQWIPVRPGCEGALLLGIAHVLVTERLYDEAHVAARTQGFVASDWTGMSPQEAGAICDVAPAVITRLARELARSRPSSVLFGGSAAGHTNSVAAATVAGAVNALIGAWWTPGGLSLPSSLWIRSQPEAARLLAPARAGRAAGPDVVVRLRSGRVGAVLVAGADPIHAMPATREPLADPDRVPLLVSFSSFLDDTAWLADWVLPDHTGLERWVTDLAESGPAGGCISVAPPALPPAHDTRSLVDSLIALSEAPTLPGLPFRSEVEMIDRLVHAIDPGGADAAELAREGRSLARPAHAGATDYPAIAFPAGGVSFNRPRFERYPAECPLILLPLPSPALGDGRAANLPRLQELADPITQQRWGFWVEMNPRDARALGLPDGARVTVSNDFGKLDALLVLTETTMPGTLAAPAGQGHEQFGRYARGRGANLFALLAPVAGEAGGTAWSATRVSVRRARRASGGG